MGFEPCKCNLKNFLSSEVGYQWRGVAGFFFSKGIRNGSHGSLGHPVSL